MHEVASSSVRTHANPHASAHRPHASARPALDFEAMLETMADSTQLSEAGSGTDADTAVTGSTPGGITPDIKVPTTGNMPPPFPADALRQVSATASIPDAQHIAEQAPPSPAPTAADAVLQPATSKPGETSMPEPKATSDAVQPDAGVALALIQQAEPPAVVLAPQGSGEKPPVKPVKKDDAGSDALPKSQGPDACDPAALALTPDVTASASASVPQAPAGAAAPATPFTAADPTAPAAPVNTDRPPALATTLPRPPLPAFQPGAPPAASLLEAKRGKGTDRNEFLPAAQTDQPQGMAPPSDQRDPLMPVERKPDAAAAPQHRSPADLQAAFVDRSSATPDQLPGQTTFSGGAPSPTLATGSHATIVSGAPTTSPAAQNQFAQQQPVPLSGVPVLIASKALAGDNRFDIRLDPPELGRIEVRLKVDRDGQISSHLIADRPDTLALLRRDEAGLQRALQDAGFKTAGDGLQFSLRDQSGNGQADTRSAQQPLAAEQDTTPRLDAIPSGYLRYSGRIGGLDIRV